jgi:hypothetical protein
VVDQGHEPERIEIELTSHDPAGAGRARRVRAGSADDDLATTEPGKVGEPGLLGSERGRLIAVGAAAAVIALLIGVLVGRMGSGDVESSDAASSTTAEATTTTRPAENRDTLPRAPEILTPTTTRPQPATTTTVDPEQLITGTISIDPAVPPDDVEVVVLNGEGDVVRIDVASGATVSTRVEGSQLGPPFVDAGKGWVLVHSFDETGSWTVIFDDGSRSSVDLGSWFPSLTSNGGSSFWRLEIDRASGAPTHLVEVAVDGSETGAVLDLDGFYPQLTDPLGGVVVQAPGGYYLMRPDVRTRFTSGQLIALGERRALVNECDEQLVCGYFVVDRTTGARTQLALDPALGDLAAIEIGSWWSLRDPMSPDENALLIVSYDQQSGFQTHGVLDLTTGEHTEIGALLDAPQMVWSPGGRSVYWLDVGRLMVFDPSTGESVLFSDDLDTLTALTVRPS